MSEAATPVGHGGLVESATDGAPLEGASTDIPLEWKIFISTAIAAMVFGPPMAMALFGFAAGEFSGRLVRAVVLGVPTYYIGREYFTRELILDCRTSDTEQFRLKSLAAIALTLGDYVWLSGRTRIFNCGMQYQGFLPWEKVVGSKWKLNRDPVLIVAYRSRWAIHLQEFPVPANFMHEVDQILSKHVPGYPRLLEVARLSGE